MIDSERAKKGVHANIEYDFLCARYGKARTDEAVEMILEIVCANRPYIKIAGDDYPATLIKDRFLNLRQSHIGYAFDCLDERAPKIHNIKA